MKPALRIALLAFILGAAWIWGSDWLLQELGLSDDFQTIKGLFFIGVMSTFVYFLVYNSYRKVSISEETYRGLFNDNPEPLLLIDRKSERVLRANASACHFYGYTEDELINHSLRDFEVDSPFRATGLNVIAHQLNSNRIAFVQRTHRDFVYLDKLVLMVGIRDLTDAVEIQAAMSHHNTQLDSLLKAQNSYLVRLNREGHILYRNDVYSKDYQLDSSSSDDVSFYDGLLPIFTDRIKNTIEQAIQSPGTLYHLELPSPPNSSVDGNITWEFIAIPSLTDAHLNIQAIGLNQPELARLKKEQHVISSQLEILLESLSDGFFVVDRNLQVKLCNSVFAELVSMERKEIVGLHLTEVIPNFKNTRTHQEIPSIIESKEPRSYEAFNVFFDVWLLISVYPFEDGAAVFYRDITELKEASISVEKSERNLQDLIDTSSEAIWSVDTNLNFLTFNQRLVDFTKSIAGELPEKGKSALYDKDSIRSQTSTVRLFYERALAGESITEEFALNFPNEDQPRHISLIMNPMRSERGEIIGVSCYARDFTELETHRTELVRALERHDTLAEATRDAIWDYTPGGNELEWSAGLKTTFGYADKVTCIEWWEEKLHPEDKASVLQSFDNALKTPNTRSWYKEYRFLKSDGEYAYVRDRGIVVRDEEGNAQRMIGSMHDFTAEKLNQQQVERLSLVAERTTNSVLITSPSGVVEWCNHSFESTTQYELSEIIGRNPGDFLFGEETDPKTIEELQNKLKKGEPFYGELVNYKKDGTPYWTRVTISPILDNGKVERFVAIETNITDEKNAALKIEKQNIRLKEIANTLSHDLRKPISSILGLLELYDAENPSNPMNQDVMKYLTKATKELDNMVRAIIRESARIN